MSPEKQRITKASGSHIPRYISAVIQHSFHRSHTHKTFKHMPACWCWHSTRRDAKSNSEVLCCLVYFNVFGGIQTCCIYGKNSHRSHSLTGYRWGQFPFHDNLLCWNDIRNSRICFTYSNVIKARWQKCGARILHKYILSSVGRKSSAV